MTGNGLGQGLSDMWRSVLLVIPKMLVFLVILAVGYLVARLLRAAVGRLLRRAGFDRVSERGSVGRVLAGKIEASDLCAKLVFYGVLLFALQLAFGVWGPNPVSQLLTALIAWLPRALVAIVIIVVASAIAGAVNDLIASALGGLGYGRMLARAVAIVIVTLGVIAALDQVQIATAVTRPLLIAVLATVAGVVIVGVGGGLIRPMQQRWEGWLDRAGAESAAIREHARAYAEERSRLAAEQAHQAEEVRPAEEARPAEGAGLVEGVREAERAGRVEGVREAERAGQVEGVRLAGEVRPAEEARRAERAGQVEGARLAERVRQAERVRHAEDLRLAEEARRGDEACRAAEARLRREASQAEEARRAAEAR